MEIEVSILGENFTVEYDLDILSSGSPGTGASLAYPGDPPEPPEFEITVLGICHSSGAPVAMLPLWIRDLLEQALREDDRVLEAVYDAVADSGPDPDDYRNED